MPTTLRPLDLHCEYRRDPLGLDVATPRLGWGLAEGGRDAVQSAWQIQVGSAPGLAEAWDSGRVAGDTQIALAYAGKPLAARTRQW
jgi:alpha-L-rhamnosidase